jgi:integral membrane protein
VTAGAVPRVSPAKDWTLLGYRTIAYVVGVFLPVLAGGAIYGLATAHGASVSAAAGRPPVVKIIGPVHGFLYIMLLLLVLTLFFREWNLGARWPLLFTVLVGLSGTVPFLSFVAERAVTRRVRARRAALATTSTAPADHGAASRPPTAR